MSANGKPAGWTFFKVVGVVFGAIAMLGFGLCTLTGIIEGAGSGLRDVGDLLAFILPGLLLTWGSFLLVRKIIRSTR